MISQPPKVDPQVELKLATTSRETSFPCKGPTNMNSFTRSLTSFAVAFGLSCFASLANADITLPKIINSNMVLQQGQPINIWGWADADESVTVGIADATATATADESGKWSVKLPAMKADGKVHTMTVVGNNTIELTNILVGEVWLGSGQSNMALTVNRAKNAEAEIEAANYPELRLFLVPRAKSNKQENDTTGGEWQACNSQSVAGFSATAYYFARELQQELKIPVGIIASSWGGTKIEPWTPKNGQQAILYNAMIHPLAPFSMRGFIWYQGESNVLSKAGLQYFDMKKQLIEDWRKVWKNDELSFNFVHIAPWSGRYEEGELPKLWEAQTKTLTLPHTGMAVITDAVDNIGDIHPISKQVVGKRLALWALAKNYGKDVVYSGPLYKSMVIKGNQIRLKFDHAEGGLASRDGKPLTEFTVAGSDGEFVSVTAKIDGSDVIVSAESVSEPVSVRFGWHKTASPNLVNQAGLPAAPFQTDNWLGDTEKKE